MAPASFPAILGLEAAGVVDEVGAGVTGVAVGDEVMAWTVTGSYAEYALADDFALKPAGLDWETAAALPVALETSDRVLDTLEVTAGETLLMHGAAGVVARVRRPARGGPRRHRHRHRVAAQPRLPALARRDPGQLRRRTRRPGPGPRAAGHRRGLRRRGQDALDVSIELRGGTDRIVTITDVRAFELGIVFSGSNRRFGAALTNYAKLVANHRLNVRVAASFPLADAAKAHNLTATGHPGGKVILTS